MIETIKRAWRGQESAPTQSEAEAPVVATKKKLTVLVDGAIGDGRGGYFKKGDTFEPGFGCDAQGLKDRGFAE